MMKKRKHFNSCQQIFYCCNVLQTLWHWKQIYMFCDAIWPWVLEFQARGYKRIEVNWCKRTCYILWKGSNAKQKNIDPLFDNRHFHKGHIWDVVLANKILWKQNWFLFQNSLCLKDQKICYWKRKIIIFQVLNVSFESVHL